MMMINLVAHLLLRSKVAIKAVTSAAAEQDSIARCVKCMT